MLLDTVITVLRETLEAGVLISVLVSLGKWRGIKSYWLVAALGLGIVCATFYALNMRELSMAFDYAGQEVVNATMQYLIYALLLCLLVLQVSVHCRVTQMMMVLVVALVITREGAEIMILFSALVTREGMLLNLMLSGFIGLAIGASVGIICFYLLSLLVLSWRVAVHTLLLALISAGMVSQATRLLIQVDWISAGAAVWNSSSLLSENSVAGQMAYAIFGYEATPSLIEIVFYNAALIIALVTGFWSCTRYFGGTGNNISNDGGGTA